MKKVLALVLALTMVLGFAATASAYNIKYDLITAAGVFDDLTVGGESYDEDMSVEGNKEYTFKLEIDESEINPSFVTYDASYDALYLDFQALNIIENYYSYPANRDWTFQDIIAQDTTTGAWTNPMTAAAVDSGVNGSDLWVTFAGKFAGNGGTAATFADAYKAISSEIRELERSPYYTNYVNGYYGYDKGIVATATSKDSTYATVTSQPTVTANRNYGADTTYTVEFKVRFTNTTFRMADVDIELVLSGAGSTQQNYYESKETYSFTVFQAQYRTFTEQDALIAFGVTPNAVLLPAIPPRNQEAGARAPAPTYWPSRKGWPIFHIWAKPKYFIRRQPYFIWP